MKRIDKIDNEKFTKLLRELLNKKDIRCNDCNKLITFTTKEEAEKAQAKKPYVYGTSMICNECEFEDDITQAHIIYKDGFINNLAEYLGEVGLFDELNSWEEALQILEDIDSEIKDRSRKEIKKENEIDIAEARAKELGEAIGCAVREEEGFWLVSGAVTANSNEDATIGFVVSFLEDDESRFPIVFYNENTGITGEISDVIDKFSELLEKDIKVKELTAKYECLYGMSEEEGTCIFNIQYTTEDYSTREIIDTLYSVFDASMKNIYNINSGSDKETAQQYNHNIAEENINNYIHMKKLSDLFELYKDTMDDIYIDENTYEREEDELYSIYKDKYLGTDVDLGISNANLCNNKILVSLERENEYDIDEQFVTGAYIHISLTHNNGTVKYNIALHNANKEEDCEVIDIGETDDIYKVLICSLNLKYNYLNNIDTTNEDVFTHVFDEHIISYIKGLKQKPDTTAKNILTLVSTLNNYNLLQPTNTLKYTIDDYAGYSYSNHFTITTNEGEYKGQCSTQQFGRYRVAEDSKRKAEFIENQTLEELLDFILRGESTNIENYIHSANNLIDTTQKEEDLSIILGKLKESIKISNAIANIYNYYTLGSFNPNEGYYEEYNEEYSRLFEYSLLSTNLTTNVNSYSYSQEVTQEIEFESDNSRYIIKIDDIENVNGDYTYNVKVIEKGNTVKYLIINGLYDFICTLGCIKECGISALDDKNKIQWQWPFSFNELEQECQIDFNKESILDLFAYLKRTTKQNNNATCKLDILLDFGCGHFKVNVIDKNNFKYTIDHQLECEEELNNRTNNYTIHKSYGFDSNQIHKTYTASTKRDVLDIILDRNLKAVRAEDKYKEIHIISNLYFKELCSYLDMLHYMSKEGISPEDSIDRIIEIKNDILLICRLAANAVSSIVPYINNMYSKYEYCYSNFDTFKIQLQELRNESYEFNTENQDLLKEFKCRKDIQDFAKFIRDLAAFCSNLEHILED